MNKTAVCVLGMHRSGTSVVTRAINLLGPYLGEQEDLLSPSRDNVEGFWERKDIVKLHDKILFRYRKNWDSITPMPENWYLNNDFSDLRQELISLIKGKFLSHPIWMWKDPRTMLVFDLWKDVLREMDVELKVVYVLRKPFDVAKSLEKRDRFSTNRALGLWLNQTLAAMRSITDIPTVFVSYDKFLSDWKGDLLRCSRALNIEWPPNEDVLESNMKSFIRPDLRHNLSPSANLADTDVKKTVQSVYNFLLDHVNKSIASPLMLSEEVMKINYNFMVISGLFTDDINEGWFLKKEKKLIKKTIGWKIVKPALIVRKRITNLK